MRVTDMEVKLLEIRDRNTFIATMAVRLFGRTAREVFLLRRAGYSREQVTGITDEKDLTCPECGYTVGADLVKDLHKMFPAGLPCMNTYGHKSGRIVMMEPKMGIGGTYTGEPYVILAKLDGVEAQYDPFRWPNFRTLGNAHQHIIEHWSELTSGDVVDVEFILGESKEPKQSERVTVGDYA